MVKLNIDNIKHNQMLLYLMNSFLVTFIDIFIVWIANRYLGLGLVTANTIGVIVGFVIHYVLSSKKVFNADYGILVFLIYLGTFLIGIVSADLLIYAGNEFVFSRLEKNINFLLSKGLSIVGPFFIMYYLRRFLYDILNKASERK